jgi:hypothetical protein
MHILFSFEEHEVSLNQNLSSFACINNDYCSINCNMHYYIKCRLNSKNKQRQTDSLRSGSLARNIMFYGGMQTALRFLSVTSVSYSHILY